MAKDIILQTIDKKVELVATGITNQSGGSTVVENIGFSEIKTSRDFEEAPGQWRPIYKKTVNFGTLPNNASKTVPHNISDISKGVSICGRMYDPVDNFFFLPYVDPSSTGSASLYFNITNIIMSTFKDRTSLNAYVYLEYTKTTDTPTAQPRYN